MISRLLTLKRLASAFMIASLMLAWIVVPAPAATSELLNQGFEATGFPPTGWAATSWERSTSQEHGGSASARGTSSSGTLTTPDLNTTGAVGIIVDFYYYRDWMNGALSVSYCVGTSCTQASDLSSSSTGSWQHYQATITDATYLNKTNFRLRFTGGGGNYSRAYVDDVVITKDTGELLTVTKSGTGSGTVTSNPAGINCGSTCSKSFPASPAVVLTAAASGGSTFTSWTGCDSTSGNTCTVAMSAAKTVNAVFTAAVPCYALTLTHTGSGSDPAASPANSAGCSVGYYTAGQAINLSGAVPVSGWTIGGWSGTSNDASTAATNALVMPAAAQTAAVNYTRIPITYYVDNTNAACSDAGAGSLAVPFCTITRGGQLAIAGDTVYVLHGTYAEVVSPDGNGAVGFPLTFKADPGVTVTGSPIVDSFGFSVNSKSYLVIDGFNVTGTKYNGINVLSSNHITIKNNHVSYSGDPANSDNHVRGIYLKDTTYSLIDNNIADHNTCIGIRIVSGGYNTISNNLSYSNASVVVTDAAGIQLDGSNYNTIIHNVVHSNEDSGINIYKHDGTGLGSQYNLVIGNLAYGNGDHGIDNNNSAYNTVVGNTVHGNGTVGINFEGETATGSHHAVIANNIMSNNGINPPAISFGGNLRVDAASIAGTTADYDLFNRGDASVQIIWNDTNYVTLAAFRAAVSGKESHGLEGDPLFVAPVTAVVRTASIPYTIAESIGDYRLNSGSPAIDSANSDASNEPLLDLDGNPRVDDPDTANTGAGTRFYDDRGAYEYQHRPYTLDISVVGSGTVTKAPNQAGYSHGTEVTLTPAPSAVGWAFTGWSGANAADLTDNGNGTYQITMTGDKVLVATFERIPVTLTVNISPAEGGTVTQDPAGPYRYGDVVALTPVPTTGWHFVEWTGDLTGATVPGSLTLSGNKTVTAVFAKDSVTLTVNVSPAGSGTVTQNPAGPNYLYGDVVSLTPVPTTGWHFVEWTGDLTGTATPGSITLNGSKTVTAVFAKDPVTLTVNVSPAGSGTVTQNPAGPNYLYGDVVSLTPVPTTGWHFVQWSGDLTGTATPGSITLNGSKTVTAVFAKDPVTLTVNVSPAGGGTVTQNPAGPNYLYGDVVSLTPVPTTGWHFVQWSGDLTGTATPGSITLNGSKTVTAVFAKDPVTLTVNVSPAGSGTVTQNPAGPDYLYGDLVTLTANPASGWHFVQWTGNLSSTSNPAQITLNGSKTVTAVFARNAAVLTIVVDAVGCTGCSVTTNPNPPYEYNTLVQLTPAAPTGWHFDHWSGALSGSANPASLLMDGDKTVTATFVKDLVTLTVYTNGSGSVNVTPAGPYHFGDEVQIQAIPVAGWHFVEWTGSLTGSSNPTSLILNSNKTVTAVFAKDSVTLTVIISPAGSGTVAQNPAGPNYLYGDLVTLTPLPAVGWHFVQWTGDLTGAATPGSITLNGNKSVTAVFARDSVTLDVIIVGNGSVTRNPTSGYLYGDPVTLTPVIPTGWAFSGWSGPNAADVVDNHNGTYTIALIGNKAITATFTQLCYTLTTAIDPAASGSITPDIAPNCPNGTQYLSGTVVRLTAIGSSGYGFSNWTGDLSGSTNPHPITMDGNRSVTAVFALNAVSLFVNVTGGGTVTQNPVAPYFYGAAVTLTPVPDTGWHFVEWTGDLTGATIPANITLNGDRTVTAVFAKDTVTLTVNVSPAEGGSVTQDPAGPGYLYGDVVTLTPVSATGWHFVEWTGDLTGTENPGSITLTGDKTVTAVFAKDNVTLTMNVSPAEGGSVTQDPAGPGYLYGDVVTLTPVPATGWHFVEWTGDLTGTENPGSITLTGDKTVTAVFAKDDVTLTVIASPAEGGSITTDPAGPYLYGAVVQLTPVPAAGWYFVEWTGDLTGPAQPASLALDGSKTVTAVFARAGVTLDTNIAVDGSGTVTVELVDPAASAHRVDALAFTYGDKVKLTAIPATGWSFDHWTGDLSGTTNPATLVLDGNKTVGVVFTKNSVTLAVNVVGNGTVTQTPNAPYVYGDVVQLTPVPAEGWEFSGWSGACSGSGACSITLNGSQQVTANFTQKEYTVKILVAGRGTISATPLKATYHYGDTIHLQAVAGLGIKFAGWSGDISEMTDALDIVVKGNMTVTANFSGYVLFLPMTMR